MDLTEDLTDTAHFLRADFCNFKGRKYLLRQGVLPSVFPWDKSKLEAIKLEVKKEDPKDQAVKNPPAKKAKTIQKDVVIKQEDPSTSTNTDSSVSTEPKNVPPISSLDIKDEPIEVKSEEDKEKVKANFDEQMKIVQDSLNEVSTGNTLIDFSINSKVQVLDNQTWYAAKIKEVDYDESEVLIQFENAPNKCDEWISMSSSRLRSLQENVASLATGASVLEPVPISSIATQPKLPSPSLVSTAPFTPQPIPLPKLEENKYEFEIGERVMAAWSDSRKFPATIGKKLDNGAYEVHFDDGYIKAVKPNRIAKVNVPKLADKPISGSPLFDPVSSTKEERREKKRKINVAELFQKRPKLSSDRRSRESKDSPSRATSTPSVHSADESALASPLVSPPRLVPESSVVTPIESQSAAPNIEAESAKSLWYPSWHNNVPVGEESQIETANGVRKSIIVPDPKLPHGWAKHLYQRTSGLNIGKWEVIIKSPADRRFRCRNEIKNYLELHPEINACVADFDFSLYGGRPGHRIGRKPGKTKTSKKSIEKVVEEPPPVLEKIDEPAGVEVELPTTSNKGFDLKIVFDNGVYKCPLEGCGKQFRRENLALMHVKHYHAEYSKYLESMPNVADLAYARTVGESLDSSPVAQKAVSTRTSLEKSTPKPPKVAPPPVLSEITTSLPLVEPEPQEAVASSKDAEIIRILNKALLEDSETQQAKKEISKPDIKLKDLLSKESEIPLKDENYLRTLSSATRTPTIKTLLPVRSTKSTPEVKQEPSPPKSPARAELKRKSSYTDSRQETPKTKHHEPEFPAPQSEQPVLPAPQELPTLQPPTEPMQTGYDGVIIENGKIIKLERMKQEEIINCLCGFTEEDGLMIQCELCLCWQHAYCNNIAKETEVPEKYICYICQNPLLERRSCKYLHDQEWLKQGVLPTASFHTKDKEMLTRRYEKLKRCHNISGGLLEMKDYLHTVGVKLMIAESKNHPKLYLWSKPWDKPILPEKAEIKKEDTNEHLTDEDNDDHQYMKNEMEMNKADLHHESILSMILKGGKDDVLNIANNIEPIIPQAESVTDTDDCRLNLLDHISHSGSLIEERLDDFERQLDELEKGVKHPDFDDNSIKTKQTIQLLLRDLEKLKQFSEVPMT